MLLWAHLQGVSAVPGAGEVEAGLLHGPRHQVGRGLARQQPRHHVLAGVHHS